ncbi:hypothetical protein [Bradyrhizobium sp. 23AC]
MSIATIAYGDGENINEAVLKLLRCPGGRSVRLRPAHDCGHTAFARADVDIPLGNEVCSPWVSLSIILIFFFASDLGFVIVADKRMTMLASSGETEEGVRIFRSAWVVVLVRPTAANIVAAPTS